ncbi:MAG: hypothetical protein P1P86_13380, partial [Bacteroidales bacterium]|nr:hypothetical protein [Bacteroidales bacterium]
MKTRNYTIGLLIALVFASTNIQAQSARRSAPEERKERAKVTKTYTRESSSQKAKSTQAAQKVQNPQVRKQNARPAQPAQKVQNPQVRKQNARTVEPERNVQTNRVRKPVSMSTSNNPRSTYRRPNNKITTEARYSAPVKSRIYDNRAYYGGNYYHYAYPT